MTMRHIGLVLADVMRSVESQRAAIGPRKFPLDVQARMEAEANIERAPGSDGAMPAVGEGADASNVMKRTAPEDAASVTFGGRTRSVEKTRPKLVAVNDKNVTSIEGKPRHSTPHGGDAPRSLGFPLVLVVDQSTLANWP